MFAPTVQNSVLRTTWRERWGRTILCLSTIRKTASSRILSPRDWLITLLQERFASCVFTSQVSGSRKARRSHWRADLIETKPCRERVKTATREKKTEVTDQSSDIPAGEPLTAF